jgi:putative DNA primase/helicase
VCPSPGDYPFPEQIAPEERDPQLKDKIARELAVIVRQLMQQFSDPMSARTLLQSQQNSDEALSIKRDADPAFDFCGYLETLPQTTGCLWVMPVSSRQLP